jgi:hypothetical protein
MGALTDFTDCPPRPVADNDCTGTVSARGSVEMLSTPEWDGSLHRNAVQAPIFRIICVLDAPYSSHWFVIRKRGFGCATIY